MVENIVIGKPIVEPWTMFASSFSDWVRMECEKTFYTNERFLPKILVDIGAIRSINEVRRNRPDLLRTLEVLDYEEIKIGKKRYFIMIGE